MAAKHKQELFNTGNERATAPQADSSTSLRYGSENWPVVCQPYFELIIVDKDIFWGRAVVHAYLYTCIHTYIICKYMCIYIYICIYHIFLHLHISTNLYLCV